MDQINYTLESLDFRGPYFFIFTLRAKHNHTVDGVNLYGKTRGTKAVASPTPS